MNYPDVDDIVDQHVQWMTREMKKREPDENGIMDRMKLTSQRRHILVSNADVSTLSLLERFPALRLPSLVNVFIVLLFTKALLVYALFIWTE